MVRVAMNTSNSLRQTGLCKLSIAQSRMCCIALFSASENPSVQKVPIPQASALRSKKHFAKMCSLHPPDAEHKGFGHSPTSILNLDFEIRFENRKLVPSCIACYNTPSLVFPPPTNTTNSTGKNGLPIVKYFVVDKRIHLCYSDNGVTDIVVI